MTQKQPEQPSKITMLAPMALVLAVYSFMFFSPQHSKLSSAQSRFEDLSATHHDTEHEITDIQRQTGGIKKDLRETDSQISDLRQQRTDISTKRFRMLHQLESHSLPAAKMQIVTRLMETHRLSVIESQKDSGAANEAEKVLKSVRDLLQDDTSSTKSANYHSKTQHTHFAREVYKLKVRGRFQDLQAALESLAEQTQQMLPLSLQMESMELDSNEARQSKRIWTLTIMV